MPDCGDRRCRQVGRSGILRHAVDVMSPSAYQSRVTWQVEYTDEFGAWWDTLGEDERIRITASVGLLERCGPNAVPAL